jgi:hypothetical protein
MSASMTFSTGFGEVGAVTVDVEPHVALLILDDGVRISLVPCDCADASILSVMSSVESTARA